MLRTGDHGSVVLRTQDECTVLGTGRVVSRSRETDESGEKSRRT